MNELFYGGAILIMGGGAFFMVFSVVYVFGGQEVRNQIKKEW